MDRAEAFAELAQVTARLGELKGEISGILDREKELYTVLELPHPNEKERPIPRKRITKERTFEIRHTIISTMRDFAQKMGSNGLVWMPMSVIVTHANQVIPDAEESEIEGQLRFLAKSESSPIKHNGQRGYGSSYTYTGTLQ